MCTDIGPPHSVGATPAAMCISLIAVFVILLPMLVGWHMVRGAGTPLQLERMDEVEIVAVE